MENRNDLIIEELQAISCPILAGCNITLPYSTPSNQYDLELILRLEDSLHIKRWGKYVPFELPNNYFEELPGIIQGKISLVEEDEDDLISFPAKEMPFGIPTGYFENFKVNIPEDIAENLVEENEHTVPLKDKGKMVNLISSYLNKYSVAAILLLMFSVSSGVLLRFKENKKFYEAMNNMNIKEEIAQVSTEDISNYLNDTPSKNIDYLINPTNSNKTYSLPVYDDFDSNLLQSNSPKEIEEYLTDDYDIL
ncbi:hypothetical protein [Rhizosphaericola mali]|uniref:Uncharacterized protein n=1 Tax=Rhizosphaericola mali TaxID=2545455 RepID=A0A5P2FYI1_9BACT|nr:hypothetical protein [Rhizosphaericola mali]QES87438.1 hypothetical protein E0W69_001760 [Rhizosphaericola mali]